MRVLLVSGSTRSGSANTAALATAAALAPPGVTAVLYQGLSGLPAFNPDHDGEVVPDPVAELRREIAAADAVLFCTPEYAGTLPGSFKNLLDWTVGGGQLYEKPVAWLNVAAANRGQGAQQTLASVLGYVGAVTVDAACRHVPVDRSAVGPDGIITDPGFTAGLAEIWAELARHAGTGGDLELLPCPPLSGDEFQELLSQLNDALRGGDAVGDVVRGGGRLIGVWVLGVVALAAHPVKFAQCAPVPRELCLHEFR